MDEMVSPESPSAGIVNSFLFPLSQFPLITLIFLLKGNTNKKEKPIERKQNIKQENEEIQ